MGNAPTVVGGALASAFTTTIGLPILALDQVRTSVKEKSRKAKEANTEAFERQQKLRGDLARDQKALGTATDVRNKARRRQKTASTAGQARGDTILTNNALGTLTTGTTSNKTLLGA